MILEYTYGGFMLENIKIAAKLMRFDRPVGFLLLIWPCLWALWFCTAGKPEPDLLLFLLFGAMIARSAGCVINDIFDADIDRHVERTKNRPLAMDLWPKPRAIYLFICLMFVAAVIAWQLGVWYSGLIAAGLMAFYPKFKRFFAIPQLWLGLNWAWSVVVVWDACNVKLSYSIFWLFLITFSWTLAFDTLYAVADRAFDRKLKLHSMALWLGAKDLIGIALCYFVMLLAWVMFATTLDNSFYCLAGTPIAALFMLTVIFYCRNREPTRCYTAFQANNWLGAYLWLLLILTFNFGQHSF